MMHSTNGENLNVKYIIFLSTKNDKILQMLEVSKSALFTFSDPRFCQFCIVQNTEFFDLDFNTPLEYIIIDIYDCFRNFLKLKNAVFDF